MKRYSALCLLVSATALAQSAKQSIEVNHSGKSGASMFAVIGNGAKVQEEFGRSQAGLATVDAFSSVQLCAPSYTVHQCNGVAGYVNNSSTRTNAVGLFGQGFASSDNTATWAGNLLVQDAPSLSGRKLAMQGLEVNVNANSAAYDYIRGLSIIGESTSQPFGSTALAIFELGASRHKQWSYGLFLGDDAAGVGIQLGTEAIGNSVNSQPIRLYGRDALGVNHFADTQVDSNGNYLIRTTASSARVKAAAGGFNSSYFESNSTRAAHSGQLRLASGDGIAFRNTANNGDMVIGKNSSDQLTVPNGIVIAGGKALTTSNQVTGVGTSNPSNVVVNSAMPLPGTTGAVGGTQLAANSCSPQTVVNVKGARQSMTVVCSPMGVDIGDGVYWKAWISGEDSVSLKVCASAQATPVRAQYSCRVIQ